jgi:GT2 family glycosyltransferase
MNVSIVMPIYNPDRNILKKVLDAVKKQKFAGKIELIKVEKGLGLAESMNYGINKAKYEIIVTLHQDCIPSSKDWLKRLTTPLKNLEVVACCSDVYDVELKKVYTPRLDEKGCAYSKEALKKVGLFDNKTFLNSGEDYDMYMKLKKIGKIAYPHSLVEHHHPGYLEAKGYKRLQNANTWGCLFRVYGFSLPGWYKPLIKANIFNQKYFYWFWRGFLKRKQDFKR